MTFTTNINIQSHVLIGQNEHTSILFFAAPSIFETFADDDGPDQPVHSHRLIRISLSAYRIIKYCRLDLSDGASFGGAGFYEYAHFIHIRRRFSHDTTYLIILHQSVTRPSKDIYGNKQSVKKSSLHTLTVWFRFCFSVDFNPFRPSVP